MKTLHCQIRVGILQYTYSGSNLPYSFFHDALFASVFDLVHSKIVGCIVQYEIDNVILDG